MTDSSSLNQDTDLANLRPMDRRYYDMQITELTRSFSDLRASMADQIATLRERMQSNDHRVSGMEQAVYQVRAMMDEHTRALSEYMQKENEGRLSLLWKVNMMLGSAILAALSALGGLLMYLIDNFKI